LVPGTWQSWAMRERGGGCGGRVGARSGRASFTWRRSRPCWGTKRAGPSPPCNGAADVLHALARGAIRAGGARGPALASLACLSAPCGSRSCGARQWKSSTDAAASAARAGGRGMTGGCARGRTSEPGRHRGGAAARRRRRSSDATRSAQSLNRMARWSSTSNAASRTAVSRPSPARAAAHPSVRLQLCALPRSST